MSLRPQPTGQGLPRCLGRSLSFALPARRGQCRPQSSLPAAQRWFGPAPGTVTSPCSGTVEPLCPLRYLENRAVRDWWSSGMAGPRGSKSGPRSHASPDPLGLGVWLPLGQRPPHSQLSSCRTRHLSAPSQVAPRKCSDSPLGSGTATGAPAGGRVPNTRAKGAQGEGGRRQPSPATWPLRAVLPESTRLWELVRFPQKLIFLMFENKMSFFFF